MGCCLRDEDSWGLGFLAPEQYRRPSQKYSDARGHSGLESISPSPTTGSPWRSIPIFCGLGQSNPRAAKSKRAVLELRAPAAGTKNRDSKISEQEMSKNEVS